jgi:7,8-dihydroneopterin aldolase/epimerase/oxygenase
VSADVRVELRGLSAYGAHGVSEAEREVGRRIVLDIAFTVVDCGAVDSDELAETVDYGAVAKLAADVVTERSCKTLERLSAIVADELTSSFEVSDVEVRAAKPDPPISQTIGEVAVTLRRSGAE